MVHGTSELPISFVALMVCTCRRWDRVTTRLIAAVEDSALLNDAELDELGDSFLAHEHVISYPLAWASPEWLEVELDTGNGRTYTVDDDTLAQHRPSFEPPLRRWAARRALRSSPARLDDLLRAARGFEPRHRDALVHGLLDAADVVDEGRRRRLISRGLQTAQASVRRTALDPLCDSMARRRRAGVRERTPTPRSASGAREATRPATRRPCSTCDELATIHDRRPAARGLTRSSRRPRSTATTRTSRPPGGGEFVLNSRDATSRKQQTVANSSWQATPAGSIVESRTLSSTSCGLVHAVRRPVSETRRKPDADELDRPDSRNSMSLTHGVGATRRRARAWNGSSLTPPYRGEYRSCSRPSRAESSRSARTEP